MKYLLTAVFALLVINLVTAQVPATVSQAVAPYPGMSDSFSITLEGVDEDFVESSWRQFIDSYLGATGQISKDVEGAKMESVHVLFPPLGNEIVDILALIRKVPSNKDDTMIILTIWIHREDNSLLSPAENEETARRTKDWLWAFDSQLDRTNFSKD